MMNTPHPITCRWPAMPGPDGAEIVRRLLAAMNRTSDEDDADPVKACRTCRWWTGRNPTEMEAFGGDAGFCNNIAAGHGPNSRKLYGADDVCPHWEPME